LIPRALARSSSLVVALLAFAACKTLPVPAPAPATSGSGSAVAVEPKPALGSGDQPDPPPKRLLDIDWDRTPVATDAEAAALWQRIAPTGDDWDAKLNEIPEDKPIARALALALLHEGGFACKGVTSTCRTQPVEVPAPSPGATLADPCLRRVLALWALDQLEPGDFAIVLPALRAILALPPPESQLIDSALAMFPETNQDELLRGLVVAWQAGHRDTVAALIGKLDEAHQVIAATQHHLDPAVEVLSPEAHRALFVAATADEQLSPRQRIAALREIALLADPAGKRPPEVQKALLAAAAAKDCGIAAAAARILFREGNARFLPKRTATMKTEAQLMRAMCVLASYEDLQEAAEDSLLPTYLAKTGFERVTVAYDPLGESNADGDNDPHTDRSTVRVEQAEALLPELTSLVEAMRHCTGSTCIADDHEFKFEWKAVGGTLVLARLEVWERPPCKP